MLLEGEIKDHLSAQVRHTLATPNTDFENFGLNEIFKISWIKVFPSFSAQFREVAVEPASVRQT